MRRFDREYKKLKRALRHPIFNSRSGHPDVVVLSREEYNRLISQESENVKAVSVTEPIMYLKWAFETGDRATIAESLGDYVRETKGINWLAEQIELSDRAVSNMLSWNGNPTLKTSLKIMSFLDICLSVPIDGPRYGLAGNDQSALLGNPNLPIMYLKAAFQTENCAIIAKSLGEVVGATIKFTNKTMLAKKVGVCASTVKKGLSENGNPKLSTLLAVMSGLNVPLSISQR